MKLIPYICLISLLATPFMAGRSLAALPPEAQAAVDKGVLAAKEQEWDIAIQSFQEARKTAPNAPEVFYNLGLAESKIPGRELRAIAWFGAYLAVNPNAQNAVVVRNQIGALDVKNQANLFRLLKSVQDATNQTRDDREFNLGRAAALWAESGDMVAAMRIVESIQDAHWKDMAEVDIEKKQLEMGDISDAQKSLDSVRDALLKTEALQGIGHAQFELRDAAGAQDTYRSAQRIAESLPQATLADEIGRYGTLLGIARDQADAGDIAGAQKTLADAGPALDIPKVVSGDTSGQYDMDLVKEHIAEAQAIAGDIAGAQKTADSIKTAGLKTDLQYPLAMAYVKTGDWKEVKEIAELMPEGTWKNDVLQRIANQTSRSALAQATDGDISRALEAVDRMPSSLAKDGALEGIVEVQVVQGDIAGAQRTIEKIQTSIDKENAQRKLSEFFDDIVEAQANSGDMLGAQKTASQIPAISDHLAYYRDLAEIIIVRAEVKGGNTLAALDAANLIHDPSLKADIMPIVADARVKAGDLSGAREILVSARGVADSISAVGWLASYWKCTLQARIAKAQVMAQDVTGADLSLGAARTSADSIQDLDSKVECQALIADIQTRAGDPVGARSAMTSVMKTIDAIQDANEKSSAQEIVVTFQAQAGDISGAQESAELIQDMNQKGRAQAAIVGAQAESGNMDGARKIASSIQDIQGKDFALADIVRFQARNGDVAQAQVTADRIQDISVKSYALMDISEAQAKSGDIPGAQTTVDHVPDAHAKNSAQMFVRAMANVQGKAKLMERSAVMAGPPSDASTPIVKVTSIQAPPVIPDIRVSDWLARLDDSSSSGNCPLNTDPFLDISGYLTSQHSDSPAVIFSALESTADKLITAQNVIVKMLKQQATRQAAVR